MENKHVRNIAFDLVITLLTCGLFNLYIQYKQIDAINDMIGEPKYSFVPWLLLTLITCGIYHIYHEFRKSSDIATALGKPSDSAGLVAVVLIVIGLFFVVDAIQQSEINAFYGDKRL